VPELILRHNLHGIDIDTRCAQIAALALWMRAQKAWTDSGITRTDRPPIRKTNIVVAQPMPGEREMLDEFIHTQLSITPEDKATGALLRQVFERMKLAGEAGSLLQIEEDIREDVEAARQRWAEGKTLFDMEQLSLLPETRTAKQQKLSLAFSNVTDAAFWDQAEKRIYEVLHRYAQEARNGRRYQRRLFVEDAEAGFAFIDACRKRYDAALMNPPFGDASLPSKPYIDETYGDTKGDVYKAFVECFQTRLTPAGYLGVISSRTGFFLGQSEDWRTRVVLRLFRPVAMADLGSGVLDAMVEVAAYVLRNLSDQEARDLTLSLVPVLGTMEYDKQGRFSLPKWQAARGGLKRHQASAELEHLEGKHFVQRCSGDLVRYTPLWQAVKKAAVPPTPLFPPLVCIRVLSDAEKGRALGTAIAGRSDSSVFITDTLGFHEIPSCPFAYWISGTVRSLFKTLPKAESTSRRFTKGLCTTDDERFLRAHWEIDPTSCGTSFDQLGSAKIWASFAKGGVARRFYTDVPLVIKWASNGAELKAFLDWKIGKDGQWSRWVNSVEYYFQPGLTWPLRAAQFSPQVLPAGCIFSVRGYAAFAPAEDLPWMLGLMASSAFDFLFKTLLGRFGFPEFVVGALQQLPIPELGTHDAKLLGELARKAWAGRRQLDGMVSTSHIFLFPELVIGSSRTLRERAIEWGDSLRTLEKSLTSIQHQIDALAFRLYGFDSSECAALGALANESTSVGDTEINEEEEQAALTDTPALTANLLAYALGCAFGRWDVRFATDRQAVNSPEPNPFAHLPVCPPGMLQNDRGLPAGSEDISTEYPINIPWQGILADDPGNSECDIEARIHGVLRIIFGHQADDIYREAVAVLDSGALDLRGWLRRSFFQDHIKRHSRSRRKAPIYWCLSTQSGSYSLWLYYHRFNKDTVYKALNDHVKPKVAHEELQLTRIRQEAGATPTNSQQKEIQKQETFVEELKLFATELARVAPLWNPNLNDGVIINFAPLWRLVSLRSWQKECKECWANLVAGEYDWSHLAMHLWPERVVPQCATDRSLAIAHDLEAFFWEEKDGKWHPIKRKKDEVQALIAERTSTAVKAALADLLATPSSTAGGRKSKKGAPA